MSRTAKTFLMMVLCTCLALGIYTMRSSDVGLRMSAIFTLEKDTPFIDTLPVVYGFQPKINEDIPTIETDTPIIPHILHQIWIDKNNPNADSNNVTVPLAYKDNVKSFVKHNPDWTYYIWTAKTGRQLIADKYQHLLRYYDSIDNPVAKCDVLRFVVVYEFGGMYADLDTEIFRPLDRLTTKYSCFAFPIPWAHAVILFKHPYYICSSVLMCRPRHPFFKQVVEHLPLHRVMYGSGDIAGPPYLTLQYKLYNKLFGEKSFKIATNRETKSSPYFYKGQTSELSDDGIFVPNTQYFVDKPLAGLMHKAMGLCTKSKQQTSLVQRLCEEMKKWNNYKDRSNYTYFTHRWSSSYPKQLRNKRFSLKDVVPNIDMSLS